MEAAQSSPDTVVPHNLLCTFIKAQVFNCYMNWRESSADNVLFSIVSVNFVNVRCCDEGNIFIG